jgi:hypothetical protein
MQLELSDAEQQVLTDVLTRALSDLREEIFKTDTADYKAGLRGREQALKSVLARLGSSAPASQ